jgi:hypothetical protein
MAGGTAHGFALFLGLYRLRVLWALTAALIGAAAVLILTAGLLSARRPAPQSAPWLKGGLLATLAALAVLPSRFSLHEHFNYNDIYHVVQTVGLYFFYRGAALQACQTARRASDPKQAKTGRRS